MNNTKITFIGGGNMARALIGGLCKAGVEPACITVSDPSADQRSAVANEFGIKTTSNNARAVQGSRAVVLAVKPQVMGEVLDSLRPGLNDQALIISVAAGITLAAIADRLGADRAVVRAMPNTPALYGAGMTGLVASAGASADDRQLATTILACAGEIVWIESEALMDAVTAVSGSGPAYFFALTEQLAEAGAEAGLPMATAAQLARQTAIGAGVMLARSELDAAELRQRVTSPGGTTEAALNSLAADDLDRIVRRAVEAAVRRGRELGAG